MLSSSTLFVFVFFYCRQQRVNGCPAGALVCFRLDDAYVIRQSLSCVLSRLGLLTDSSDMCDLLPGEVTCETGNGW